MTVLYFAGLRERRGVAREEVEVEVGQTVGGLYDELFGPDAPAVACTIDRTVCPPDSPIPEGAEVSFLPPLGGG